MDKVYTIEELKTVLIPIFKRYGLDKVGLFGSYAHGKARPKSDIDLLTLFDETFGLEKYENFKQELKKVLNKRIDILDYRCLHEDLKEDILNGEVILYESKPEDVKGHTT